MSGVVQCLRVAVHSHQPQLRVVGQQGLGVATQAEGGVHMHRGTTGRHRGLERGGQQLSAPGESVTQAALSLRVYLTRR